MMKNKKAFTRLCKEYHTFFEGYQVPVGASYGRTLVCGEEWFWVVSDYSGLTKGNLLVHFMKKQWLSNQDCRVAKMTWHTCIVSQRCKIYKEVLSLCRSLGGVPKVGTYTNPKYSLSRQDKRVVLSPITRKKAQADFVFRCKPQGGDNADQSHCINNQSSYWSCQKDMMRNVCNYGGDIYGRP